MKFRRIISIFIFAVIMVAFFTNPKHSDFNTFLQPQLNNQSSAPLIKYNNSLLYSSAEVTFFSKATQNGQFIAIPRKEKYIGLFGRFWQID